MLTEKQQEIRAKGIGASEAPAIMGLDPFKSPLDVYLKKLGLVEDKQTFHTKRGQYLEPALIEWASDELGIEFLGGCQTMVHAKHAHMIATPDAIARDHSAIAEIKAPGPRMAHLWGDDEEGAPDNYVVQLCDQMAVVDVPQGYLVALVDGELRTYHYERDLELEGVIADNIEKFWRDHIEKQVPPPVDGSKSADNWLRKRFPRSLGEMVTADSATESLLYDLKLARSALAEAETKAEVLTQRVKELIGERDGVMCPLGKVTWRSNKDVTRTDWEALAMSLAPSDEKIALYTTTKPGSRVFRVSLGK